MSENNKVIQIVLDHIDILYDSLRKSSSSWGRKTLTLFIVQQFFEKSKLDTNTDSAIVNKHNVFLNKKLADIINGIEYKSKKLCSLNIPLKTIKKELEKLKDIYKVFMD